MPPRTRSVTARSRPPNPPSLPTLEEDLRNLDPGGDRAEPPSPIQPPSPEYDPGAERREAGGIEYRTTPKIRKITRTVASSQRDRARDADPNEGRCLLTNRSAAVQLCHLVAQATGHETLKKLEYVWGLGYQRFNLDTSHNMMHLRADWHLLFDQPQWVLIPEIEVLRELIKIYISEQRQKSNLTKRFEKRTFKYYVVPAPMLQEPICRFSAVNSSDHTTHNPPFSNLGSLTSHIHPHYVVFNTGQKLVHSFDEDAVEHMARFLAQILSISEDGAYGQFSTIKRLYQKWTGVVVPDDFREKHTPSNQSNPPDEAEHDSPSQGGPPPRHHGLRRVTRSQGQGSQGSAQGQEYGGQQQAILPFQPPEDDDSSSVTDDTVVEDDTAWIEYIYNWQKRGASEFGTADGWGLDVLNDSCDKQLVAYINEHARTPPSPGAWDSWKPTCDTCQSSHPSASDRSRFSSNDWAVFKNDVYLTRPEHPVTFTSPSD